jgi:hypothetical protein
MSAEPVRAVIERLFCLAKASSCSSLYVRFDNQYNNTFSSSVGMMADVLMPAKPIGILTSPAKRFYKESAFFGCAVCITQGPATAGQYSTVVL